VDTNGFTEIVFALFDLLNLQFSPRIRDIGDQRLYRMDRTIRYRHLEPVLTGTINQARILTHWDDMLRVAGSLKYGWVTASLFISKLQAFPRQNALAQALQEYGRLIKTIFMLRYLQSPPYRQRINGQLNKGESLHALRQFLFFANEGKIRHRYEEDQANQASCLTLVTNAVITWNTVYMAAVLDQLRAEGHVIADADVVHLSPARSANINRYGKYRFNLNEELERTELRPLRKPRTDEEQGSA
jgi:TnpA family transposase